MAVIPYPEGLSLIRVRGLLAGLTEPRSAKYRVRSQRKVGYVGTPWMMDNLTQWYWLKQGVMDFQIPHSDAPGLTGDNGALLDAPLGYSIELLPTATGRIEVPVWQPLMRSLGAEVNFASLANLGGWPETVVVIPPIDPGTGGDEDLELIEIPPGSGSWGLPPVNTGGV